MKKNKEISKEMKWKENRKKRERKGESEMIYKRKCSHRFARVNKY